MYFSRYWEQAFTLVPSFIVLIHIRLLMSPGQPLEGDVGPDRQGTATEDMVAYWKFIQKGLKHVHVGPAEDTAAALSHQCCRKWRRQGSEVQRKFKASILYLPSGPLLYYFNNRREKRIVRLASPNTTWHNLTGKVTARASLSWLTSLTDLLTAYIFAIKPLSKHYFKSSQGMSGNWPPSRDATRQVSNITLSKSSVGASK